MSRSARTLVSLAVPATAFAQAGSDVVRRERLAFHFFSDDGRDASSAAASSFF